jgi:hypothetical protein
METRLASERISSLSAQRGGLASRPLAVLLIKTLLVCAAAVSVDELVSRAAGARPEPSDLLTFKRFRQAVRGSSTAVALLGSSRMLADIDPRVLRREFPGREFYQLALDGASPMPLLENLANDPDFHGLILCEFHSEHFLGGFPFTRKEKYLGFASGSLPYGEYVDTWLIENAREHLAVLNPQREQLIAEKLNLPGTPADEPREDRFLNLHRAGKDNAQLIARWMQLRTQELTRRRGRERTGDLVPAWVQAIRDHGGEVVFVELPVSGALQQLEDRMYPSRGEIVASLLGHKIALLSPATEPALAGFECPDESHLDADSAASFSSALAEILKERNLLERH